MNDFDKNKSRSSKIIIDTKIPIKNPDLLAQDISNDIQELHTKNKDNLKEIVNKLIIINNKLKRLKTYYPKHKDIYLFSKSLKDLEMDFFRYKSGKIKLDESMDDIKYWMLDEVISKSGVKIYKSNELLNTNSELSRKIVELKKLDINIDYVVTNGKKKNETIIYFPQIHAQEEDMKKDLSKEELAILNLLKDKIYKSQNKIAKIINKFNKTKYNINIFEEALPKNFNIKNNDPLLSKLPNWMYTHKLESNLDFELIHFDPQTLKEKYWPNRNSNDHRVFAHNVFASSSLAKLLKNKNNKKKLNFVTYGLAHEYLIGEKFQPIKKKHQIPFSHTLAYYDVNVIVIDTTDTYNPDLFFPEKKKQKLGNDISKGITTNNLIE